MSFIEQLHGNTGGDIVVREVQGTTSSSTYGPTPQFSIFPA